MSAVPRGVRSLQNRRFFVLMDSREIKSILHRQLWNGKQTNNHRRDFQMRKSTLSCAALSALCGIVAAWGNDWSFEPPPRQRNTDGDGETNQLTHAILPPVNAGETVSLRELEKRTFSALLDERLRYGMRRFNPRQTVEHLSNESPIEWLEELRIRDGKKAVTDGLKLTGREFGVTTLGIGGFIGDLFGGKKIGTIRPSLFETSEGITGWHLTRTPTSHLFWEGDPFRENPYAAFGYRTRNVWDEPRFEVRTRLAAEDWQHPRLEAGGTLYLKRNIALETGVQVRSEVEHNGNSFGKGDDQRLAVFVGLNLETRYGNFFAGASGLQAKRAFVAFEHRW